MIRAQHPYGRAPSSRTCKDMEPYISVSGSSLTVPFKGIYLSLVNPISSACIGGV